MRRPLAVTAVAFVVIAIASCREPTQITVTITTDAKCTDVHGVAISVGVLGDALEGKPPSATSTQCDPATGRVGSIVIVPRGSSSDEVALRVTAGFGGAVEDCAPPYGSKCIVARRSIRYIPHTPLFVPIRLTASCAGVPCDATSTCQSGSCVSPVVDPTRCESPAGCDLPDAGAPDGAAAVALHEVAIVGNVPDETGCAQQKHLLYATHSARWWHFRIDDADTSILKTRWSTDLMAWTESGSLSLSGPSFNPGRNFSVAYADIAGKDVVHIATSQHQAGGGPATPLHARALIDGATIAFTPATAFAVMTQIDDRADPDCPVTALSSDGHVFSATGWLDEMQFKGFATTGNMDVFESSSSDDGTSAGPLSNYVVHSWVPQYVNARALVPLASAAMLAVWPSADTYPDTADLSFATSTGGWMTMATLFGGASPTAQNDWSVCAVTPTTVHAVRRKVDGGKNDVFEHARFDTATGAWSADAAIPSDAGSYGTGIVLLTNGTKLLLFAIGADGGGSVRVTKWDGATWGPWSSVFDAAGKRAFLTGTGCEMQTRAAIAWTEGGAAPFRVMAAEVTGLF